MGEQSAGKPEPVATIYRVQFSGTCEDCDRRDVTVIEADIGQSSWTLICLDCLVERLHELQEKLGTDNLYHRFGMEGRDRPAGRAEERPDA